MSVYVLKCSACGDYYRRHANRPGRCGPCQQVAQRVWQRESGCEAALTAVQSAICSGVIPAAKKLKCVDCGRAANRYDHRDYSKPLEVVPVCGSCNKRRGPAKYLEKGLVSHAPSVFCTPAFDITNDNEHFVRGSA